MIGHQDQPNAGTLRRLTGLNRRRVPALAEFRKHQVGGVVRNLRATLSVAKGPLPENQSLEPHAWGGLRQARKLGTTLTTFVRPAQLCRYPIAIHPGRHE